MSRIKYRQPVTTVDVALVAATVAFTIFNIALSLVLRS